MAETITLKIPESNYVLVNAEREGLPEIISVNQALLSFPNGNIFPWHLKIDIQAKELAENGIPTPKESKLLFKIADQLEAVILGGRTQNGAVNALFLARSTWSGWRELYFYCHDPEIVHSALQLLIESGKHRRYWAYTLDHDSDWERAGYIFQLFSPPEDLKM